MARRKSITKRRRALFLDTLKKSGSVTRSAIAGEIGRSSWYDLRARDPDFAQEWDDHEQEFLDGVEGEGIRRAVQGVRKVSHYVEYLADGTKQTQEHVEYLKSDRLLELILKARHPLYKPTKALELTSPDGSMSPAPDDINPDNLSNEELQQLVRLQRKLRADSNKS